MINEEPPNNPSPKGKPMNQASSAPKETAGGDKGIGKKKAAIGGPSAGSIRNKKKKAAPLGKGGNGAKGGNGKVPKNGKIPKNGKAPQIPLDEAPTVLSGPAPAGTQPPEGGVKAETTIQNRLGLHARAATKLSQILEEFDAEVYLVRGENAADAKSILDLLGLCCPRNTRVEIVSVGKDARKALDAAVSLIENNFGEEE
jgi:phosphotransferase system HPr (HPr) family protein